MRLKLFLMSAALLAASCGAPEERAPPAPAPTPPALTSTIATASDARALIEASGFTDVANYAQNAEGRWTATAQLNGQPVHVMIDATGVPVVYEPDAAQTQP